MITASLGVPRLGFLGIFFLCSIATTVHAENWPGFRGPTHQGISSEKNLPLHWNATSNVAWKMEVPGQGWSSPIVWGERLFLTTTTENGSRCYVLCFERESGKLLWNKQVLQQLPLRKENKNSYATPTPVTDGNQVYAVFGSGAIVAVKFDGSVAWTNTEVQFYSRHGLGASPILHGEILIMPFDGSNRVREAGKWPDNSNEERLGWQIPWDKSEIAAIDRRTGRRVWTARRGQSRIAHVTPIVYRENGQDRLLSVAGDAVQGFDLKTGERLWSVYCQGEGVTPSPVLAGPLIVASSGFEKTTLRGIRPGGRGDVTSSNIVWEQKKGVPTQSSLLYAQPYVYAITDGGIATCYKPEDGEIVWQERVGGNYSASPVLADGHIYFLNEAGESTVIAAGPEFRVVARNPIGETCQASMAVAERRLFIRSDKSLFCIAQR
jgi:outer membrane protein assembly factor BamB